MKSFPQDFKVEKCGKSEVYADPKVTVPHPYIQISVLQPYECVPMWRHVRDYLKPAVELSNGRWTLEYVIAGLATGQQNLWIAADENKNVIAAATTQVVDYPMRRMLTMHFIGGDDFDSWYTLMLNSMSAFAKSAGCDGIECVARMGFWKWFKEDGFSKSSAFYERPV